MQKERHSPQKEGINARKNCHMFLGNMEATYGEQARAEVSEESRCQNTECLV